MNTEQKTKSKEYMTGLHGCLNCCNRRVSTSLVLFLTRYAIVTPWTVVWQTIVLSLHQSPFWCSVQVTSNIDLIFI